MAKQSSTAPIRTKNTAAIILCSQHDMHTLLFAHLPLLLLTHAWMDSSSSCGSLANIFSLYINGFRDACEVADGKQ